MKQIVQRLKDGRLKVLEVPPPLLRPGLVLVRNHYSLISAGTEGSTVRAARQSLIGKARSRPQQVRQALELLKRQGPIQAYRAVMKKLEAYSPLGYSSSGEVLDVGPGVKGFKAGDLVACAGAGYASHAEVVAVPVNLCVKLHRSADLRRAAFNTLGAVALQGVRQADLRLGESCGIIGLGLVGQLSGLLLKASGVRTVGVDLDPRMVRLADGRSVDLAFRRNAPALERRLIDFTSGLGLDAVIIAASSSSVDPVNLAGRLCRKKGHVVVVGDVPTGFDRESYYRKELDLRLSCSYGPGRYDPLYEEKGIDYPAAYVRWTEKRNMQAFQELARSGKLEMDYLVTHVFDLAEAPRAYDLILKKSEPFLGILLRYDGERKKVEQRIEVSSSSPASKPGIGFIGAGSYAQGNLLPHLARRRDIARRGVLTISGEESRTVAERFRFEFCTAGEKDILGNADIQAVFIATRHDTHAPYVLKSLKAGKHTYVEKPLCLNESELQNIRKTCTALAGRPNPPLLLVGFNRRFSTLARALKERLSGAPLSALYRVNAGPLPADSWIHDPDAGGGRVVGEVCHFVDFLLFISGSLPHKVFALALPDPQGLEDTLQVSLSFQDGSIGTIQYLANGSRALFKEYIEVSQAGLSAVLQDFKSLEVFGEGRVLKKRLWAQDKGQARMLRAFLDSIRQGGPPPIPFEEIYSTTLATFKTLESLRTGQPVTFNPLELIAGESNGRTGRATRER